MGFHLRCYDSTGAKASDFKYADAKTAGERFDALVKAIRAGDASEVYVSVALVENDKEVKRYPDAKAAKAA